MDFETVGKSALALGALAFVASHLYEYLRAGPTYGRWYGETFVGKSHPTTVSDAKPYIVEKRAAMGDTWIPASWSDYDYDQARKFARGLADSGYAVRIGNLDTGLVEYVK